MHRRLFGRTLATISQVQTFSCLLILLVQYNTQDNIDSLLHEDGGTKGTCVVGNWMGFSSEVEKDIKPLMPPTVCGMPLAGVCQSCEPSKLHLMWVVGVS